MEKYRRMFMLNDRLGSEEGTCPTCRGHQVGKRLKIRGTSEARHISRADVSTWKFFVVSIQRLSSLIHREMCPFSLGIRDTFPQVDKQFFFVCFYFVGSLGNRDEDIFIQTGQALHWNIH